MAAKRSEGGDVAAQLLKTLAIKKKNIAAKKDNVNDGVEDDADEDDDDRDHGERQLQESDVVLAAGLLEGTFGTVLDCVRDLTGGNASALMDIAPRRPGDGGEGKFKPMFEVASGDGVSKKTVIVRRPVDSEYERWKERVLREARISATKTIEEGGGSGSKDWLKVAADAVLREAGL